MKGASLINKCFFCENNRFDSYVLGDFIVIIIMLSINIVNE